MDYNEFKKEYGRSINDICRDVFYRYQKEIRIKKERTAVKNLTKIFKATFKISAQKGFHAMSMRDLSLETHISLGAMYAYFPNKEKLRQIIFEQSQIILQNTLDKIFQLPIGNLEKLNELIRAHIFLSEFYRPWFYFAFMESHNLKGQGKNLVIAMEFYTQEVLYNTLISGERQGVFKPNNHELTVCLIKGMQQEWYLKRWKYSKKKISPEQFTAHVIQVVDQFCHCKCP